MGGDSLKRDDDFSRKQDIEFARMSAGSLERFDLTRLAENGMRRGFTTGACAAAAVKAAIQLLQFAQTTSEVSVTLPDQAHYLILPIKSVASIADNSVQAEVVKDAGDDPDNTDGATIFAKVAKNDTGENRFIAGSGVGTVTRPGIRVPVGEPAINPGPRLMIAQAISDLYGDETPPGFDITIGCVNGSEIAKRTFNPRLGIKDGISILGTTGIVEPYSLAAYMASIEVYIRVAIGEQPRAIAFLPGNIGIRYCKEILGLDQSKIVHISNFVGFSVDHAQAHLIEIDKELPELWILGHPGKLGKLLDGEWDTHSSKSSMAMAVLSKSAGTFGLSAEIVYNISAANTVEAVIELLSNISASRQFWSYVENQIKKLVAARIPAARKVEVRLFGMAGAALGQATGEFDTE